MMDGKAPSGTTKSCLRSIFLRRLRFDCRYSLDLIGHFAFRIPSIYALCIRAQTPAPSPNSLPSRTATVAETGLRSLRIS